VRPEARGSRLGPKGVEEFGQSGAGLGQLLAFDLILRAQVGGVIVERDGPSAAGVALGQFESQASEGLMRDAEAVRSPAGRPVFDATLARRYAPGILQQLSGGGLADIRRDVIPFVVQVDVLVVDGVATDGLGRGIDLVRGVGIDEFAVRVQIDGTDMQGLMQITDKMSENE